MKNTFKIISLVFILGLTIASCGSKNEGTTEEQPVKSENRVELSLAQFEKAGIQLGNLEQRVICSKLRVNGVIDVPPQSNVSINMPYGGFVKHTKLFSGSKVKKGQLLVVIENPEFIQFQQDYLVGLANQEYLKAEYERQNKLFNEKVASGKSFQQAKSDFHANEARIKSMEERLKLIGFSIPKIKEGKVSASVNIYSPVTGAVRKVYTNVGKYINPEDVIMDIINTESLYVKLSVYEDGIPRVKKGQRIYFALANSPDEWREAEVFLTGSVVSEDRSVTVFGHLKQVYDDLKPGMYVTAKIETDCIETLTAPEESIVRFSGKQYVFAYSGEKSKNGQQVHEFEMIEVQKGNTEEGYTQISLLDSSMNIKNLKLVTKGAFTLLAKAKNT